MRPRKQACSDKRGALTQVQIDATTRFQTGSTRQPLGKIICFGHKSITETETKIIMRKRAHRWHARKQQERGREQSNEFAQLSVP